MELTGRKAIYTDQTEVNEKNICGIIEAAMPVHNLNSAKIRYLYNYYKGRQPIKSRKKKIRSDICNKIVENRAKEIVDFKVGYLCGKPIQYTCRSADDAVSENVSRLNDLMVDSSKITEDESLVEWQMIAGTGYRIVLPSEDDEEIFEMYSEDPRNTFVVYSNKLGHKPVLGVYITYDKCRNTIINAYSKDTYYRIEGGSLVEKSPNILGMIPIIEYPANNARIGAFECVIDLLDAINNVDSNRLDGIEQFVQSLVVLYNCDLDKGETASTIKERGLILLRSLGDAKADIKIISEQLDQMQTQTLKNDMYETVLTICAMPSRTGGASTSDNGIAVVYRDGWSAAEVSAQKSEAMFKKSEREFLKVVLKICRVTSDIDLKLRDLDITFTRGYYENMQTKSQVLTTLLNNPKVAPKLAFESCGIFSDPQEAYTQSMEWYKAEIAEAEKAIDESLDER